MKYLNFFLIFSFLNLSFAQVNTTYIDNNESIKFTYIEQELSQQWVSSIIQDKDSFMWFATQDGLYRYDGNKFLTYRYNPQNSNSLPANWVRSIVQDKDGIFWIGTQGEGLVRFDQKNNIFKKIKSQKLNGIKSVIVYNIAITSTNAIWAVGDDGIYRKSNKQTEFIKVYGKSIDASFIETSSGGEIILLDRKLYRFNKKTNLLELINNTDSKIISISSKKTTVIQYEKKLITSNFEENLKLTNAPEYIWNISNIQNGTCIIIGNNHIYRYNINDESIEVLNHDTTNLSLSNVNALYLDKQHILWIATKKGLYKENKAGKLFLETIPLHARRIVVDNNDTYIGGQDGLYLYSPKKTYKKFSKEKIFSVIKGKNGIWAGDIFGTIYYINKEYQLNTYKLEKGKKNILKIYGLAEDANEFLWVSSWNAMYVLNKKGEIINKFTFKTKSLNNELKAIQIHLDKKGDLWVLTVGNGLYIIPKIAQISLNKKTFNYKHYTHIDKDSKSLNSNVLYEIHEDINGTIWIGSDFGINKYIPESDNFEALKIDDNLFDKKVMGIECDNKGTLWINTIKDGIYVYNPINANLINFNEDDGLISNSGLFTSSTFENGKMYFGTDKGVQIINPKNSINPLIKETPIITDLNVFGENPIKIEGSLLNEHTIDLKYNQTDLTIDFSLHDYRFPQKINYYYLLKNGHTDWRKAENNSVSYTNLAAGQYEFMVKASYNLLSESSPVAKLFISVASPWYKTIWAYTIFTGLISFIVFMLLYLKFKQRIAQYNLKTVTELNTVKSKFFSNVSHEFRTPLTLISGPIQKQLTNSDLKDDDRNDLEMMQRNTNRLLNLVNQLLDISKIESGNLDLKISKEKIMPFIGLLADGFSFKAKQKQINYITNIKSTDIDTWFDKDIIEKIIVNILSNAFKYTPEMGAITCNAYIDYRQLHFEVKNTGKGIPKEDLNKVFNRFHQQNESNRGIGIGLALVKELVTLHKGKITVKSTPNKLTTFHVKLPIDKAFFNENQLVISTENNENNNHTNIIKNEAQVNVLPKNTDIPILLIVEDNLDVRTYIESIFKKSYTIILAKNGDEGINLAIKNIPDIIISDIMMPVKNGIELCNTLKTDVRTSHIPIILLTAKAGDENKLEGIKTGADDYITKPFKNEFLQLKVEKLIENIKKLQNKFSQEIVLKPKDIAVNSTDELFFKRIQDILDKNLVESSFNTEEFCKAVSMSRMQLHRKLKALLGMSTSEFIRSQRLKLAAELLKKSDINVSQIGYSVGFNDHAYFSKRFKEMYNCSPTEYVNKLNK